MSTPPRPPTTSAETVAALVGRAYAIYERNATADRRYVMQAFRVAMRHPRRGLHMLVTVTDHARMPEADLTELRRIGARITVPEAFTIEQTRAFISAFEEAFFATLRRAQPTHSTGAWRPQPAPVPTSGVGGP